MVLSLLIANERKPRAAVRDALSCITPSYTSIKTRRTLDDALHKRKVKKSPRDEIAFALAQRGGGGGGGARARERGGARSSKRLGVGGDVDRPRRAA